jgi:hypothetical protein
VSSKVRLIIILSCKGCNPFCIIYRAHELKHVYRTPCNLCNQNFLCNKPNNSFPGRRELSSVNTYDLSISILVLKSLRILRSLHLNSKKKLNELLKGGLNELLNYEKT